MGVQTSEVGYTIATTRRETTKVHKNMWWHWGGKKERERERQREHYLLHSLHIYFAVDRLYLSPTLLLQCPPHIHHKDMKGLFHTVVLSVKGLWQLCAWSLKFA